jgi:lactococcin 972 family bacteriocin
MSFEFAKSLVVKGLAIGAVSAVMFSGATATAGATESGGGSTASATANKGGVAVGDFTAAACQSADGGDWCYGSGTHSPIEKGCYSNYKHNIRYHSSTATIANSADTQYASAGYWSYAYAHNGWAHTCYAYYNDQA